MRTGGEGGGGGGGHHLEVGIYEAGGAGREEVQGTSWQLVTLEPHLP